MPDVPLASLILALVTLQRIGELILAKRNTRMLLARGAYEVGAAHYPAIVALHSAWLAGLWLLAWDKSIVWPWLALFIVLQGLRIWILATLKQFWTTRIIVVPDAPLVTNGPYRLFRHPNYLIVIGEIAALPLAFGLWNYALIFSLVNGVVLTVRIYVENQYLNKNTP